MVDPKKPDSRWLSRENEPLDLELESALAKYAAVEPRAGLEERVLANLQAERVKASDRNWWRWSAAVGLAAAVVVVGVALTWRSVHPSGPVIANRPSITTPVAKNLATPPSNSGNSARPQMRRPTPRARAQRSNPPAVAAVPKLDQFPSPQPLSEQEKLLWSYVVQHPERAGLVAEARMESLQRDAEERRQLAAQQPDSQQ